VTRIEGLGVRGTTADRVGVLSLASHEREVARIVAESLVEAEPWDVLRLDALPADAVATRAFVDALELVGLDATPVTADDVWEIDLPATWDDFLARLSKSHRRQLRRLDRSAVESGRSVLSTAKGGDEIASALELLAELHNRRWRSVGGTGSFESEDFTSFVADVSAGADQAGQLRLKMLDFDGRLAAVELDYGDQAGICAYQTGFDPDLAEERVGQILLMETIKAAIDEGVARYDLGRGVDPYKQHWRAEATPSLDLIVGGPSRRGRLLARAEVAQTRARRSDLAERAKHMRSDIRNRRSESRSST